MRIPTKRSRLLVLITAAVAAAFVISACGGSDDGSAEPAGVVAAAQPVSATTDADAPSALTVDMGEWFFETDSETVKAGEVEVTAVNVGDIDHELIAVKTDLPADDLPVTPEGGLEGDMAGEVVIGEPHAHGDEAAGHDEGADGDEAAGHDNSDGHHADDADAGASDKDAATGKSDEASEDEAVEGHVMPGDSVTFEVDLEPGNYVLLCTIPGHYAAGQYVSLTVVE